MHGPYRCGQAPAAPSLLAVLDLFELGIDDVILRRAGFGTARTTGCSGPGCTCSLCGIRTTLL